MAKGQRQDHYEVLGVSPHAPDEVIRAAYRALAAKYHPDRNPGDPDAELKLKRVNAAFQVLGSPEKRTQYDELTYTPEAPDVNAEPQEPRKKEAPRWKVPEQEAGPEQPRWRVPGEEHHADNVNTRPPEQKRHNTGARVFLACAAAGLSLYVSFSNPSHSAYAEANPEAHNIGFVIGCGLLALFIYWLAGKISPVVCGFGLALVAAALLAMRDGGGEKPSHEGNPTQANTVPASEVTPTVPAAVTVPDVPPLLANETPPSDGPNYFEPREVSSGGIVAGFDSCESSARKSDPTLNADLLAAYCTCFVDTYRRNFSASGDLTKAMPTTDQINSCATAARSSIPSPFRFASPRGTADIWRAWTGCIKSKPHKDNGVYCDCLVDFDTAAKAHAHVWQDVLGKQTAQQFFAGCQVADQYWAARKTHLTVRQFKVMVVAAASQ